MLRAHKEGCFLKAVFGEKEESRCLELFFFGGGWGLGVKTPLIGLVRGR